MIAALLARGANPLQTCTVLGTSPAGLLLPKKLQSTFNYAIGCWFTRQRYEPDAYVRRWLDADRCQLLEAYTLSPVLNGFESPLHTLTQYALEPSYHAVTEYHPGFSAGPPPYPHFHFAAQPLPTLGDPRLPCHIPIPVPSPARYGFGTTSVTWRRLPYFAPFLTPTQSGDHAGFDSRHPAVVRITPSVLSPAVWCTPIVESQSGTPYSQPGSVNSLPPTPAFVNRAELTNTRSESSYSALKGSLSTRNAGWSRPPSSTSSPYITSVDPSSSSPVPYTPPALPSTAHPVSSTSGPPLAPMRHYEQVLKDDALKLLMAMLEPRPPIKATPALGSPIDLNFSTSLDAKAVLPPTQYIPANDHPPSSGPIKSARPKRRCATPYNASSRITALSP